jgi:hypothetical protein
MSCGEFEALLAEALDGTLSGPLEERFQTHRSQCALCGPAFAEAASGRRWLRQLQEVEPPANLAHNILVATVGAEVIHPAPARETWRDKLSAWAPRLVRPALQPRFVMSFGMAFFSLTLLLNITGVKLSDLRHVDLRPSAIARTYYETEGRLVKYYENIRFVYELESRVQQLKRATAPSVEAPAPRKEKNRHDQSGEPDQKQYQNYSREEGAATLARHAGHGLRHELASTARRLS